MFAASNGDLELAKLLIDHGARVQLKNNVSQDEG